MFSANMNADTKWWAGPASPQWGRKTNVLKPRSLWKANKGVQTYFD